MQNLSVFYTIYFIFVPTVRKMIFLYGLLYRGPCGNSGSYLTINLSWIFIQSTVNIPFTPSDQSKNRLRLVASTNSTTVVELIVELIGELFIGELLNYNFLDSQKACFN